MTAHADVSLTASLACTNDECICNTQEGWTERAEHALGFSVPEIKPADVPAYDLYMDITSIGHRYPQYDSYTSGPLTLNRDCSETIECTLMYTLDYAAG